MDFKFGHVDPLRVRYEKKKNFYRTFFLFRRFYAECEIHYLIDEMVDI